MNFRLKRQDFRNKITSLKFIRFFKIIKNNSVHYIFSNFAKILFYL